MSLVFLRKIHEFLDKLNWILKIRGVTPVKMIYLTENFQINGPKFA